MNDKVNKCFVNGCFDVLHIGHIRMFEFCKEKADMLVVAIDSDKRVESSKGPSRPFNAESDRVEMLYSIRHVDKVLVFDSDNELSKIIYDEEPDIMVVGSDWKGKEIVGSAGAKEVIFFDRIDGYSTTSILEDLK